tara:strand:+ start:4243 stop:4461 length:219 start_codon:yes stop_codon:yes gene_type:complete
MGQVFTLDHLKFNIGELVITVMGKYGVIVGYGRHIKYPESDNCNYYHVLIDGNISCYLPYSLEKVEKNKKIT